MKANYKGSFIFSHIPKCGGTSFRTFLAKAAIKSGVPENEVYIPGENGLPNTKNLIALPENELEEVKSKKIRLLADHSFFGVHISKSLNIHNPFYYT